MSSSETSSATALEEQVAHHVALHVQSQLAQFFCPFRHRVILLSGPTGVGKTDFSLKLAQRLDGEIVSCDSMQVYRGMDIGTAKVSIEERQRVPHHLIDIRLVNEPYNVFSYFEDAKAAIESIVARGKVPIVVGGTGFYIHALLYGPPHGPPSNPEVRLQLEEKKKQRGVDFLYALLCSQDPEYAKTLSSSDSHKIIRGLEIMELSGKKVSDFSWKERPALPLYDFRAWFFYMPKEKLHVCLNERCQEMLDAGLVEEVMELDRLGIRHNSTASRAIGYRQTLEFLDTDQTEDDYEAYVEKFKIASRHLAKRQYTWFRKETLFRWVDVTKVRQEELIDMIVEDYYQVQ